MINTQQQRRHDLDEMLPSKKLGWLGPVVAICLAFALWFSHDLFDMHPWIATILNRYLVLTYLLFTLSAVWLARDSISVTRWKKAWYHLKLTADATLEDSDTWGGRAYVDCQVRARHELKTLSAQVVGPIIKDLHEELESHLGRRWRWHFPLLAGLLVLGPVMMGFQFQSIRNGLDFNVLYVHVAVPVVLAVALFIATCWLSLACKNTLASWKNQAFQEAGIGSPNDLPPVDAPDPQADVQGTGSLVPPGVPPRPGGQTTISPAQPAPPVPPRPSEPKKKPPRPSKLAPTDPFGSIPRRG